MSEMERGYTPEEITNEAVEKTENSTESEVFQRLETARLNLSEIAKKENGPTDPVIGALWEYIDVLEEAAETLHNEERELWFNADLAKTCIEVKLPDQARNALNDLADVIQYDRASNPTYQQLYEQLKNELEQLDTQTGD